MKPFGPDLPGWLHANSLHEKASFFLLLLRFSGYFSHPLADISRSEFSFFILNAVGACKKCKHTALSKQPSEKKGNSLELIWNGK